MKKRDLYYDRIPTKLLREDVSHLGNILGKVIKEQEGIRFFNLVEKVRKLSAIYPVIIPASSVRGSTNIAMSGLTAINKNAASPIVAVRVAITAPNDTLPDV